MKFFVYILYSCGHDTFYVGQTDNVALRLTRHNAKSVASTAPYAPWKLCISVEKESRSEAMKLERKLKNLSKARIRQFILKYGGEIPSPNDSHSEC